MSFMVIRFKERNLQRRIWNCVKIAKIKISQISVSKGVNVFQNAPFKDGREKGAKWSGCLYLKLNKKCAFQLQTDEISAPKIAVE